MFTICIDGNDGTGKTTLIKHLKSLYPDFEFQDRGLPTKLTDYDPCNPLRVDESEKDVLPLEADLTIILSCEPSTSYRRLEAAGADMEEHWHKMETLEYYDRKFLDLAKKNPHWHIFAAHDSEASVLVKAIKIINSVILD